MDKQLYEHSPDYATPPGATLAENMEHFGVSERELALRTALPAATISKLLSGEAHLTPEIAAKLESAISIPARIWNNLERQYRERLSQQQEKEPRQLGAG